MTTMWSFDMATLARPTWPALTVAGTVLFGLACGMGGWLVGADDTTSVHHDRFEATVESVDDDGGTGCLAPGEPTVRERLGGSVCGRLFVGAGTDGPM